MPSVDSAALADLHAALLQLEPTGADGFEGLLATALSGLTGLTFRLASSGTQDGEDGSAGASVTFEGKLYKRAIPRSELFSKITDLIARNTPPDLWIVGATVALGSQKLGVLERAAAKNGIATLVLDWVAAAPMPALAVLCAAASEATRAFLLDHLEDRGAATNAAAALVELVKSPVFEVESGRLVNRLTEGSLGLPQALAANRTWLEAAFTDRREAARKLGQPLAPRAAGPHPVLARTDLIRTVTSAVSAAPDGQIVAIVGGEGFGKSWLLAQGWLAAPNLMLLVPAQQIQPGTHGADLQGLLIAKLIEQTDERPTDAVRHRWEERLKRWAEAPAGTPRFLLAIDGLNQRADPNWARWLDAAAAAVHRFGGLLVVTVRRLYFEDHVQSALVSDVVRIDVPEWTEEEVLAILQSVNLRVEPVAPDVRLRLRNPRLLGIALDLLERGRIKSLAELSIERLLFEQIKAGAQDGGTPTDPRQFARTLSGHAKEILDRVQSHSRLDQHVFDSLAAGTPHTLSSDLLAVAGEHFFHPLEEDPTRYRLTDDGLVLALGFALVDGLKAAERNQLDIEEALAATLDPIAALDKTSEAVFAAAQVASVDDRTSAGIRSALIGAVLQLQNIDGRAFAPFRDILPAILPAALSTLERLAVADRYVQNLDWLVGALRDLRIDACHWATMREPIVRWLRTYSRNPELDTFRHGLNEAEASERLARSAERQARLWDELASAERSIFESAMHRRDGIDPGELHQLAFQLLAGMPLAPFADDLVANALAEALNSAPNSPIKGFIALLRFNLADGKAARAALLLACARLVAADESTTARWARVAVLRGLSSADDGAAATCLVEVLTADREYHPGWRRIEDYCATDPCDPSSMEPDNIRGTGEQFEAIDIATLRQGRWMTQHDHFLEQALPGIARFRPAIGVATMRRYAAAAPGREGDLQRVLLTELPSHSAALGPAEVDGLLRVSASLNRNFDRDDRAGGEAWVAAQYALMTAFPHLTGDEQLQALLEPADPGSLLLNTIPLLKPASSAAVGAAMAALETDDSINRKLAVLLAARVWKAELSQASREIAIRLILDPNTYVRSEALAVLLAVDDPEAIRAVVDSGWTAYGLDVERSAFEIWRGSGLMVRAMALGLLPVAAALDRMSPLHFSAAATAGVTGVEAELADRLQLALARALDLDLPQPPPDVEQRADEGAGDYPPMYSLVDTRSSEGRDGLERLADDPDAFHRRQRASHNAFSAFDASLTKAGARLILDNPGFDALDACVRKVKGWGQTVADQLLALPAPRRPLARNFALMLAQALSGTAPETAAALMSAFTTSRGYVGLVYGAAKVPLAAFCTWSGAASPVWDALRRARLDQAPDDATLSEEVLAALSANQSAFLERYVVERLASDDPVRQARALMVLGFGAPSGLADDELSRFGAMEGFLGEAAGAARHAYERNVWARHWRRVMIDATSPEAYWAASILLARIVDGRISYWADLQVAPGSIAERFDPTIKSPIKHRVEGWQKKRKKTLFGSDTPDALYLEPALITA